MKKKLTEEEWKKNSLLNATMFVGEKGPSAPLPISTGTAMN